ncbi:MAG TPA: YtxH domain-containing protein [Armatimonadota bacterium]|nr:YtxH domain-containing protein [Armatimonadota bacterium]
MSMRSGEFVGGLLLGALVGAALGLLFAPEAGEKMRSRIKDRAGDLKERAARSGSEWCEKSKEVLREKKEQIATRLRGRGEEEEA